MIFAILAGSEPVDAFDNILTTQMRVRAGDTLALNPGAYTSAQWSNAATDSILLITSSGDYSAYVLDSLNDLDQKLSKLLTIVRNGINEVNQKASEHRQPSKAQVITQPAQNRLAAPQPVEVKTDSGDRR